MEEHRFERLLLASGLGAQLVDAAEGDEVAALDDADAVAELFGDLEAVRRHEHRRAGRWRVAGFLLLALGFGAAIFVFFYRALSYFLSVPEFGPVLTYKLLGMVFVTFFSILLFSNIVTALSATSSASPSSVRC